MTKAENQISVFCVDDHALVLRGLRAAIQMEPDLSWAGSQTNPRDLIKVYDRFTPDIILLDVDMPGADSFIELAALVENRGDAKVVMLTALVRQRLVESSINAGAKGYLHKTEEFEDIFNAVRIVDSGGFVFPTEFMSRCVEINGRLELDKSDQGGLSSLESREIQILRLIASGCSTKEIADQIHRSVKRVESIRSTIMRKLGCADRLELTRLAIREGLVEP
jgi:DNA-binding NarL/FixJ family response regulator